MSVDSGRKDEVDDEGMTPSEAGLIHCNLNPTATVCTGSEPKHATNLTILVPSAGAWGAYYFNLLGR